MRMCIQKLAMAGKNYSLKNIKSISEYQQATYVGRLELDMTFELSTNHKHVPKSRSDKISRLYYIELFKWSTQ